MSTALAPDTNPFEDLTIDFNERSLSFKGKTQRLSKVPFDILVKLFNNVGQVCSSDFLHEKNNAEDMNTRSVTTQVSRLRADFRKLFDGHAHQAIIATIRGKGVILTGISIEETPVKSCNKVIALEGKRVTLTGKEHMIFAGLYERFGALVNRGELGGYNSKVIDTRTVDTHISRIKRVLEKEGITSLKITSTYKKGYTMQWCEGALNVKGVRPQANEKPDFIPNVYQKVERYLQDVIQPQLPESDFALQRV